MRDEPPFSIDHVRVAVVADLDLRDYVPDQLEVDFGDADAVLAPRAGERKRHIGLRLAAKIDCSVIDFVGDRLGEFRVCRQIEIAANHVHGKARHAQLLPAVCIQQRKLGHGGNLPQQPQSVEAALLDGAGGPRQLGGPADWLSSPEWCSILAAAARPARGGYERARSVLLIGGQISKTPLASSATHATATNSATYLRNSWPRARGVAQLSLESQQRSFDHLVDDGGASAAR